MPTTSYLVCALSALCIAASADAQASAASRLEEVVMADAGFVGVTRLPGDSVVIAVRGDAVRVAVRVDSSSAAALADHGGPVKGIAGEVATLTPLGADSAGPVRLDATDGVTTASVTFNAATARTMRRVLTGPLARRSNTDWVETGLLYYLAEVESPARQVPGDGGSRAYPRYPDWMRNAGQSGVVVAQFVVDSAGRVRPETFSALRSTNPALTAAVRDALPYMRFLPAMLHGRAVNSVVEEPVQFSAPRRP
jgi:TonB family protein